MHILNTNIGKDQTMYQEKVLLNFVKDNDSIKYKKQEKTNNNISSFIKL